MSTKTRCYVCVRVNWGLVLVGNCRNCSHQIVRKVCSDKLGTIFNQKISVLEESLMKDAMTLNKQRLNRRIHQTGSYVIVNDKKRPLYGSCSLDRLKILPADLQTSLSSDDLHKIKLHNEKIDTLLRDYRSTVRQVDDLFFLVALLCMQGLHETLQPSYQTIDATFLTWLRGTEIPCGDMEMMHLYTSSDLKYGIIDALTGADAKTINYKNLNTVTKRLLVIGNKNENTETAAFESYISEAVIKVVMLFVIDDALDPQSITDAMKELQTLESEYVKENGTMGWFGRITWTKTLWFMMRVSGLPGVPGEPFTRVQGDWDYFKGRNRVGFGLNTQSAATVPPSRAVTQIPTHDKSSSHPKDSFHQKDRRSSYPHGGPGSRSSGCDDNLNASNDGTPTTCTDEDKAHPCYGKKLPAPTSSVICYSRELLSLTCLCMACSGFQFTCFATKL